MASAQDFTVVLTSRDDAKAEAAAELYRYNVDKTGTDDRAPIGAELRDDAGRALGGLWGRTELGLLFLDMFFVPERLRGRSLGAQLLSVVEEEAKRRGCTRAVVETSSFPGSGLLSQPRLRGVRPRRFRDRPTRPNLLSEAPDVSTHPSKTE